MQAQEDTSPELPAVSPLDRDLWIRTVIGEAANDPSATGVASVIANRMRNSGQGAASVVLSPGQFEPWATRSRELMSYSPDSTPYKTAASIVDGIIAGTTADPTGGATQFYAPVAQKALGRNPPSWDDGTGQQIGGHLFFGGNPQVAQNTQQPLLDISKMWTGPSGPAATSASASSPASPQTNAPLLDISNMWTGPKTAAPPSATGTSANGLVWDSQGGHDPKTGALVVAGRPFTPTPSSGAVAATTGMLNGIPVVGPNLARGVETATGALHSALSGTPLDQNIEAMHDIADTSAQKYATASTIGNAAGAVGGTLALMATAPVALGLGPIGSVGDLAVNSLLSAGTGAVLSGADAMARSGNTSLALGSPATNGALAGGAFGALAPGAGKLVGSALSGLGNVFTRTSPAMRYLSDRLAGIGMSPADIGTSLQRLGPAGTLADVDPAMTTEAMAQARVGGAPTSIVGAAMKARAGLEADTRVAGAIDTALGPKPDLEASKEAIYAKAKATAAPFYTAARANPTPMDVTPILNGIDAQLVNAPKGSGEAAVLNKAKGYLTDQIANVPNSTGTMTPMIVPKSDPGSLLKVRQALDGDLESLQRNGTIDGTSAGKAAFGAASDIRGQLDDVLKGDQNIAAGDAAFSGQMRLKDAMNAGTDLFTNKVRPEDFAKTLANASPEEIDAMRTGARVAIGDAVDNNRQGVLAGARSMFGKSAATRAKLDALFPNSGDLFNMIDSEATMRATENKVIGNSVTTQGQEALKRITPQPGASLGAAVPLMGEAMAGGPGAIGASMAKGAYNALHSRAVSSGLLSRNIDLAHALTVTGAPQTALLQELTRAHAARGGINALSGAGAFAGNLAARNIPSLFPQAGAIPNALLQYETVNRQNQ